MTTKEKFLSARQRYQPMNLPGEFSDEEMARDWTLSESDQQAIRKHRRHFRLYLAIQMCAVRLYGRLLTQINDLSARVAHYLAVQLDLPPSLTIKVPEREATYLEHRQNILNSLGFRKFDEAVQTQLETWLKQQARSGVLPDELFQQAEDSLLDHRILLPGPSVLERLIIHICADEHTQLFESIFQQLSPALRMAIDRLLTVAEGDQRSHFYRLKQYPPAATISSIQTYLKRYQMVADTGINYVDAQLLTPAFLDYLHKLAKRYDATDLKRFTDPKRYALMVCFLLETRKILLDHLVVMHDQYVIDRHRQSKHSYEKKHREFRKRQKQAIDVVLDTTDIVLAWPDDSPLANHQRWQQCDEVKLRPSLEDLRTFKRLEERGYGD